MKILNRLTFTVLILLVASAASAQQREAGPLPSNTLERGLTKFDLDFPGGTPRELVVAIEKSMGRPLNAIVPDQCADRRLPPLKMKGVDVSQLFGALFRASQSEKATFSGPSYRQYTISFGFISAGPVTDDSVWYFQDASQLFEQEFCRFYLLSPYLEAGLTVDDITTAVQTSWKMRGEAKLPKMSYHKETKLLIAVGAMNNLETIDAVLKALGVQQTTSVQGSPAASEAKTGK